MSLTGERNQVPDDAPAEPRGLFGRLAGALRRTRSALVEGVSGLLAGGRKIDETLVDDIEDLLITADVGVEATARISGALGKRLARRELGDADAVLRALGEEMEAILAPASGAGEIAPGDATRCILMVGVNGTGKTTTAAKLGHRLQSRGASVMLAAGDTFRAAAIEQLQTWGERLGVPVVAQQPGADSASVVYDALSAARARGIDVLLADTAGRLHTKSGLMDELEKVCRVCAKLDPEAPHEKLLVIDATTGQNALAQARQFHQAVGVTGIAMTKLDGTAKGGIALALAELGIPLRYVGVGEGLEDLRPFDAREFVQALLAH